MYNPGGRYRASEYRFPFDDRSFDFVFLTSVFTHIRPDEVRHYLGEIRRVVRDGGRVFATFFVLDDYASDRVRAGLTNPRFSIEEAGFMTVDRETPELAIAYREGDIRTWYREAGLGINDPIRWGGWSGRPEHTSFQDIVLARPASLAKASPPEV